MSNYVKNATISAKKGGKRKPADSGLTSKERIFVHALRALFDPKGKGKAEELPKGVVSSSKVTSAKAVKSSEKKRGERMNGQKAGTSDLKSVTLTRRAKREAKLSAKKVDKSESSKGGKCPSKLRRAEKRAAEKEVLKRDMEDSKRSLAGGPIGLYRFNRRSEKLHFDFPSLSNLKVLDARIPRDKGLSRGSARLDEEKLRPGVIELEVVKAFGIGCLRMLRTERFEQLKSFPVWQGPVVSFSLKGGHKLNTRKIKRDYSQAVKGLGIVSAKNRPEPSSLRLPSAKKVAELSAKKGKAVVVGETTPKTKTKCQVRREERRKQARAEAAARKAEKSKELKSSVVAQGSATPSPAVELPLWVKKEKLVQVIEDLGEGNALKMGQALHLTRVLEWLMKVNSPKDESRKPWPF
jgi:hypothetical protein